MIESTPAQLRFPSTAGFTVRADLDGGGGAMSSDFGAVLLHGVDRQTRLINRPASAIRAQRHASYIDHSINDLLRQRIVQTACGYADGNCSPAPASTRSRCCAWCSPVTTVRSTACAARNSSRSGRASAPAQ